MVIELDGLMEQWEGLELVIEEEVDRFIVELQSERLQKGDKVVDLIIVLGEVEIIRDQLI